MTFGDLDDPKSDISNLIRDRGGFQLHTEYGTEPSIYYIDGKIGGKESNKAPEFEQTGHHLRDRSTVEKSARQLLSGLKKE
jgi:hypothetical protein